MNQAAREIGVDPVTGQACGLFGSATFVHAILDQYPAEIALTEISAGENALAYWLKNRHPAFRRRTDGTVVSVHHRTGCNLALQLTCRTVCHYLIVNGCDGGCSPE